MIAYYKTIGSKIEKLNSIEKDCWINVTSPDEREIAFLTTELGLDTGFLKSALDEEESSHIDSEDNQTLIIVDAPVMEKEEAGTVKYGTIPLGIIITKEHIITVCLKQTTVISDFTDGIVKSTNTALKQDLYCFYCSELPRDFFITLSK